MPQGMSQVGRLPLPRPDILFIFCRVGGRGGWHFGRAGRRWDIFYGDIKNFFIYTIDFFDDLYYHKKYR
jgi:hypothetical protein